MFGSIGMPELIIIFVIALIIFGPRKLPELGKSLGKSIAEFKRASNELRNTLEEEIRVDEQRQKTRRPRSRRHSTAPLVRRARHRRGRPGRATSRRARRDRAAAETVRPRTAPPTKLSRADGTRSLPRPRPSRPSRRCRPLGRAGRRRRPARR